MIKYTYLQYLVVLITYNNVSNFIIIVFVHIDSITTTNKNLELSITKF